MTDEQADPVNHPSHYNTGKIEVIDFIEDQRLGFHLGNVVKYACRAQHKGDALEDLKKAHWYLTKWKKTATYTAAFEAGQALNQLNARIEYLEHLPCDMTGCKICLAGVDNVAL